MRCSQRASAVHTSYIRWFFLLFFVLLIGLASDLYVAKWRWENSYSLHLWRWCSISEGVQRANAALENVVEWTSTACKQVSVWTQVRVQATWAMLLDVRRIDL